MIGGHPHAPQGRVLNITGHVCSIALQCPHTACSGSRCHSTRNWGSINIASSPWAPSPQHECWLQLAIASTKMPQWKLGMSNVAKSFKFHRSWNVSCSSRGSCGFGALADILASSPRWRPALKLPAAAFLFTPLFTSSYVMTLTQIFKILISHSHHC